MKLAINLGLSLLMLGLCLWFVWPNETQAADLKLAFEQIRLRDFAPYLAGYLGLLVVVHVCRAWRWKYLLEPIGVRLSPVRLLAICSVGFMAVLALPARLGELVRPALIRKKGEVSGTAALGTIAVERIADGLMISLMVFVMLFARGPGAPPWWAYISLGVFASALVFLIFALRKPEATVRFATRVSLLQWLAPKVAVKIETGLLSMISGFIVLDDKKNLLLFGVWTAAYWIANGFSLYVLALGFDLDLSLVGAFATMGLVAVGIILPNTPGLVGQYHAFAKVGLLLYLPEAVVAGNGLAFIIVLHGIQVVWYLGIGALALATPHVSFAEAFRRKQPEEAQ
jgi:hypothetical protein